MVEVSFYHLQREPLEVALPKILEKVLERSLRAVVMAGSRERVAVLDEQLWTYRRQSFLPHGAGGTGGAGGDGRAAEQPVYLTTEAENPNGATVLVLVDGADPANRSEFDRCLDMFDGNDPSAVAAARRRWQACKEQGFDVTYWQQGEAGGWEKKA